MLKVRVPKSKGSLLEDLQQRLQMAITLEFSTLPPYLYASLSIKPETNAVATSRLGSIVGEEMLHMALACNVLNAIGGRPKIASHEVASPYPRPLPGKIGSEDPKHAWEAHLIPFSQPAMAQGMHVEEPEDGPIVVASTKAAKSDEEPEYQTIGEFYRKLQAKLAELPADAWKPNRNQIDDAQFFKGELFAVNDYAGASKAIDHIVSQGEGTEKGDEDSPIDFEGDLAHYYRFAELNKNRVLILKDKDHGYEWGESLGVDWDAVYPAISDPSAHDFSKESEAARAAQRACDAAFVAMMDALDLAMNGNPGHLGVAIRHMFDLRRAAAVAFSTPLECGKSAGPTFVYPQ